MKRLKAPKPPRVFARAAKYWMHIPVSEGFSDDKTQGQLLARFAKNRVSFFFVTEPLVLEKLDAAVELDRGDAEGCTFLGDLVLNLLDSGCQWLEQGCEATARWDLLRRRLVVTIEGLCDPSSSAVLREKRQTVAMPHNSHKRAIPVFVRLYFQAHSAKKGTVMQVQRLKNAALCFHRGQDTVLSEGDALLIDSTAAVMLEQKKSSEVKNTFSSPLRFCLGSFAQVNLLQWKGEKESQKRLKSCFSTLFDFWQFLAKKNNYFEHFPKVENSLQEQFAKSSSWQNICSWKDLVQDHYVLTQTSKREQSVIAQFLAYGFLFLRQWIDLSSGVTLYEEGPHWSISGKLWGLSLEKKDPALLHLHWKKGKYAQIEIDAGLQRVSDFVTTIEWKDRKGLEQKKTARLHILSAKTAKATSKRKSQTVQFPYTLSLSPGQCAVFDRID